MAGRNDGSAANPGDAPNGGGPFEGAGALDEIARRCEEFGITTMIEEPPRGEPAEIVVVFPEDVDQKTGLTSWEVRIAEGREAEVALSEPFEAYRRLPSSGRFHEDAIWSPSLGAVECPPAASWGRLEDPFARDAELDASSAMRALGLLPSFRDAEEAEGGAGDDTTGPDPPRRLLVDAGGLAASVGPWSNAWAVRANAVSGPGDGSVRVGPAPTLRVEDAELPTAEAAADLLETVANAALFELGRANDLGLVPSRGRPRRFLPDEDEPPEWPDGGLLAPRGYDPRPMSLYWYAEGAHGTPLLRFLAYYQVLEFHFPAYSQSARVDAVRKKLRGSPPATWGTRRSRRRSRPPGSPRGASTRTSAGS